VGPQQRRDFRVAGSLGGLGGGQGLVVDRLAVPLCLLHSPQDPLILAEDLLRLLGEVLSPRAEGRGLRVPLPDLRLLLLGLLWEVPLGLEAPELLLQLRVQRRLGPDHEVGGGLVPGVVPVLRGQFSLLERQLRPRGTLVWTQYAKT